MTILATCLRNTLKTTVVQLKDNLILLKKYIKNNLHHKKPKDMEK